MKRTILLPLFIILIAGIIPAMAGEIRFNTGKTESRVTESDYFRLKITNQIDAINYFDVATSQGVFSQIGINGYTGTDAIANPQLPVMRKLIEIPFGADVELQVISSSYTDYSLGNLGISEILPCQPPVIKSSDKLPPFVFDPVIYQKNIFYPSTQGTVDVLGVSRGIRLGRVNLNPVQYNPVTKILRVYYSMEVEVRFIHPDIALTKSERQKNNNPFFRGINQQIINEKSELDAPLDTLTHFPVKYVIVSPVTFQSVLQPLVAWKKKKGFTVVEAYTNNPLVGTTTTSIKNYLQGLYNAGTVSDPAPSFVLFVGDIAQIPAYPGTTGSHVTDLYYCDYTGDNLPDVYYGRFSATTEAQLTPQINKTLQYEQYLMPDPSFLDHCVMIGGVDATYGPLHANGQINYGTDTYFNLAHGLTSHTYLYPVSGSSDAQIRTDISNGVCFANYTAHGSSSGWADPNFTTTHVPAMTNLNKYPLMVGNACLTNKFDDSECFGEALLRAANKGALGYIGASNNTYWNEDYYWGVGAKTVVLNPVYSATQLGSYDGTFHDHGETYSKWFMSQGQMVFAGNLAVEQGAPGSADYYWEVYHLMGDPSLMIYFSQPDPLTATYNSPLPIGNTSLSINTLPYAYCAVSYNGVLHGAAQANSSGLANLTLIPFSGPCTADVVVTKQNYQPFISTLTVANPNAPMCLYHHQVINDATGNNNGLLDFGESVSLSIGIQNVGLQPAGTVSAILSTSNTYITITDNSQVYGSMASGALLTPLDGFAFSVSNSVPDNHSINFTLTVTDGTNTWLSNFTIVAHAPVLSYQNFTISDPGGNNDGKLDPGETINLILNIANTGSGQAVNCYGTLSSGSSYITLNSANQTIGTINGASVTTVTFNVTASPATPAGHLAGFSLGVTGNNNVTASAAFSITVGQIPVLILDLDPNGNAATAIAAAIQANNIAVETVTTLPANLNIYASIFVCLGIYGDNHTLTTAEGTALAAYLNAGGKMYMEGGDTWAYDAQTAVHPLFNIDGLSDGSSDLTVINGQTGTFTQGQTFTYTGENNWIDKIQPEAASTAFSILNNTSPVYVTAVAYDGTTYKTIGASHEFAGLTTAAFPNTKNELMRRYLTFFGLISNQLTANFNASQTSSCTSSPIIYTDISSGSPTTWAWSFPGGNPATSSLQNPTVSYSAPGTYSVSLIIGNGSSTHSITKTDYITVNQAPAITSQPVSTTIMATQNATFSVTATFAGTYQWQVSTNGGTSYTGITNSGVYSGASTASLLITGASQSMSNYRYRCLITGSCNPAALSNSVILTVNPLAPIATSTQNYNGCSGNISIPVTVTNFSGVSAISLMLTFNNSSLTFTGYSNMNPALSGGSLMAFPSGNTIAVSWFSLSSANIGSGTLFNLDFTANVVGNFPLSFNTSVSGNCQFADLNGNTLPASFNNSNIAVGGISTLVGVSISSNPSSAICYGTPVLFTATGTNAGSTPVYTWMVNGIDAGTGTNWASDNLNNGDIVSCELISSLVSNCMLNNPAQSNTLVVSVNPTPIVDLGPDQILGAGSTLILDAGAGYANYLWSTGETTQTISVTSSGTYSVSVSSDAGCTDNDAISVIIGITDVEGYVTYDNPLQSPINNAMVYLKQGSDTVMTTITGLNGYFLFEDAPAGTLSLAAASNKPWGGVNATDALLILKHFVSISSLSGIRKKAADVDNTGTINSVDALATQRRYVGMITSFQAGDWAFEKPSVIVNGLGVVNQNIKGLCYGDVNGSYNPALKETHELLIAKEGTLEYLSGDVISYPLFLKEAFEPGAMSLEFEIPVGVKVLDIQGPEGALESVIWKQTGNTIRVSWASLEQMHLSAGETLLTLNITVETTVSLIFNNPTADFASHDGLQINAPKLTAPDLNTASNGLTIYPNPFSSGYSLQFNASENEQFTTKIYTINGQLLYSHQHTALKSGQTSLNLDGTSLSSGVYIIEIKSDKTVFKSRIIKN